MCTGHRRAIGTENCNKSGKKNNNLLAFHDVIKIIVRKELCECAHRVLMQF